MLVSFSNRGFGILGEIEVSEYRIELAVGEIY